MCRRRVKRLAHAKRMRATSSVFDASAAISPHFAWFLCFFLSLLHFICKFLRLIFVFCVFFWIVAFRFRCCAPPSLYWHFFYFSLVYQSIREPKSSIRHVASPICSLSHLKLVIGTHLLSKTLREGCAYHLSSKLEWSTRNCSCH